MKPLNPDKPQDVLPNDTGLMPIPLPAQVGMTPSHIAPYCWLQEPQKTQLGPNLGARHAALPLGKPLPYVWVAIPYPGELPGGSDFPLQPSILLG